MLFSKLITVFLLFKASNALLARGEYRIPQPVIELFQPRGFRISIDDSPGTTYVSFQININQYSYRQNRDLLVRDVNQAVDGKWTFESRNTRLKIGDKIYYNILVTNNKLRFGTGEKFFLVKELPSKQWENPSVEAVQSSPCQNVNANQFQTYSTTQLPPQTTTDSYSETSQQLLLLNCNQQLLDLQSEVAALRKENKQLISFIEKDLDAKKLTLSGRIPPNDDAVLTATFLIREKLELNPDIVSAVRKNDQSIVFEVATLAEKLEILEVAKDKLKNSRILIS